MYMGPKKKVGDLYSICVVFSRSLADARTRTTRLNPATKKRYRKGIGPKPLITRDFDVTRGKR